jgi:hypothetical protein
LTIWRPSERVEVKPMRYTTLSRRRSRSDSMFSPVLPLVAAAVVKYLANWRSRMP